MPSASPPPRVVVVDAAAPPDVTLHSWPLGDEPLAAASALLVAAAFSVGVGIAAGSLLIGVACALALAIALRPWWLPVEIQLDQLGVKVTALRRSRRIAWREFSAAQLRHRGVWLSIDGATPHIGWRHGLYIPSATQRAEVIAMVEHHVGQRMVRQL